MAYGLGVDLGTTKTAAAVRVDDRVEVVRLGGRRAEIPSLVFVRPDGDLLIGEAAERRGQSEPARLAREFKRRMGDPVPILVGGTPFSAHALTGKLLRHVLDTVTRLRGAPPAALTLTYPANWGPYKREQLEQAARLADAGPVRLRSEPEAAARWHATARRIAPGETVAVYDLGGGTFDVAVLRRDGDGFTLLGEPEGIEQLGGADFDEAVFGYVLGVLDDRTDAIDPDDPEAVAALARLRRDCVEAKEALSFDTETDIPVALPGLHTRIRLNRSELESMIAPALADTITATRRALRAAGVSPADLSAVLLAGGSSRVPLVTELLSTEFQRPVVADPNPEHSIAMGAALSTDAAPAASARPAPGPPPDSAPLVSGPPVSAPPVSGPPVSAPPVSGPPVSAPPVSGRRPVPEAPPITGLPPGPLRPPGRFVAHEPVRAPRNDRAASPSRPSSPDSFLPANEAQPTAPPFPAPAPPAAPTAADPAADQVGGGQRGPGGPGVLGGPGGPVPSGPGGGFAALSSPPVVSGTAAPATPVSPSAGPVSFVRGSAAIPGATPPAPPRGPGSTPGGALFSGAASVEGNPPVSGGAAFPGNAPTPGGAAFPGNAPVSGGAAFPGNAPVSGRAAFGGNVPTPGGAPSAGNPPTPGSAPAKGDRAGPGTTWPQPAAPPPAEERRGSRALFAVAAAALAVAVVAGAATVYLYFSHRSGGSAAPRGTPTTPAAAPAPAFPTDTMLVRVDTGPGRQSKVYTFTPGQAQRTPLPGTRVGDVLPKWSHDRKRIALTNDDTDSIWVMNADGSDRRELAGNAFGRVAWSADDRRIAFMRAVGGVGQIFVVDVDGGDARRLTWSGAAKDDPMWAPDGTTIIYWVERDGVQQLYEIEVDDPDEPGRRIVGRSAGPANDPAYSPNGSQILFTRELGGGTSDIWIVNRDGSGPRRLTTDPAKEMDPAWSPDGRWFAFVRGPLEKPSIVIQRVDGSGETVLTRPGDREGHPAWY